MTLPDKLITLLCFAPFFLTLLACGFHFKPRQS